MPVKRKIKKLKRKTRVQTTLDKILELFKHNPDHRFSAKEIAKKILGSADHKTCQLICSGYIPAVRRELEEHHNTTLDNVRKLGWKLCSGSWDTFKTSGKAEARMISHKDSYKRKVATYDLDKFPETIKVLIEEEIGLLPILEQMIGRIYKVRDGISKITDAENQKKIEKKEKVEA